MPVPVAVTPAPTKFIVVPAFAKDEPSSWIVSDPPPPPPDWSTQLKLPEPSVFKTWSALPSSSGNVNV